MYLEPRTLKNNYVLQQRIEETLEGKAICRPHRVTPKERLREKSGKRLEKKEATPAVQHKFFFRILIRRFIREYDIILYLSF